MILATILEDYNGIIQTIETFVSEEGADLVVRSICDMLTKEANRKLRCDISESKKSVQKIEKEARRAVEVLSNKETVAVQIEENFKNNPKFRTEIFFFDSTLRSVFFLTDIISAKSSEKLGLDVAKRTFVPYS